MNRRTLVIVASIIVILGIIVGGYFLFFASGPTLTPGTPTNPFTPSGDREVSPLLRPDGQPIQGAGTIVAPKLIQITTIPVAKGMAVLHIPPVLPVAEGDPSLPADTEIRFIERQSGNIYTFRVHDRVLTRVANRTVPGVQDAVWTPDGSQAFSRYLSRNIDGSERIDTYALQANSSDGFFLDQNIEPVSISSSGSLFSLLASVTGSVGSLSALDGTGTRTLFSSSLARLRSTYTGNSLIVFTKPSLHLDGYAFTVGDGGLFTRVLGPLRGLSVLGSPDGKSLLYSYISQGRNFLQIYDVATKTSTALPVSTLVEKCVWESNSKGVLCGAPTELPTGIPDSWYQGAVAFSDRLWRFDIDTRLATQLINPTQVADVSLDMVALAVDPQNDVVTFVNKTDGTLWAYDL